MRLSRLLFAAALVASPGAAHADCRQHALGALESSAPDGFAIYRATSRPDFFESWIDCGEAQFDLATAVHESTHFVTGERDAFPLVGGGAVARPHEMSAFAAPAGIAARFAPDGLTAIYLTRGRATSATDVLYLLDELNAYTHDLRAAVDLAALARPEETVDHRDGAAAMMAFLGAYAEMARAGEPETWQGLRRPRPAATIRALWSQAEEVVASSCGIPNFGVADKTYLGRVCALGPDSALAAILGRAPACPTACLAPHVEPATDQVRSDDAWADEPASSETATHEPTDVEPPRDAAASVEPGAKTIRARSLPPRHPFALRRHGRGPKPRDPVAARPG